MNPYKKTPEHPFGYRIKPKTMKLTKAAKAKKDKQAKLDKQFKTFLSLNK